MGDLHLELPSTHLHLEFGTGYTLIFSATFFHMLSSHIKRNVVLFVTHRFFLFSVSLQLIWIWGPIFVDWVIIDWVVVFTEKIQFVFDVHKENVLLL